MKIGLARLGNHLYRWTPTLYRSLYSLYKALSDRDERTILRRLIKPGMTVLDVGANIGVYTEFLAKLVGPSGRVVAFEPEQQNMERLRVATQAYKQVEVVHAAVSDVSGSVKLYIADDLNVDHRTYAPGEERPCVEVRAVTIDHFVTAQDRVDVIKMDIQGAELAAVRGARRVLSSRPAPVLIFEYWPYGLCSAGHNPDDLIAELESAGYELSTVGNAPFPSATTPDADDYVNIVARQKSNGRGRKFG